ncbi:MAG: glycosyltransferase family 39 protein [Anaerolineae bacterium]
MGDRKIAAGKAMFKNKAFALGLFLFAVYLLSGSGHTYSPDEESIVYVAQSFVTRGEFSIPNPEQYPVVGGHRGVGGQFYSGTGVGSSLLAVPFYVLANQVADAFDPHYRDFILRLALVLLFNSSISALAGMLLYAWLRRIGASPRAAVALVFVYAFATLTWAYARTFYGEPLLTLCFVLSGYSTSRFHDTRSAKWMIVAGLAAGLAVMVKLQGIMVLPALGVYFLALELPPLVAEWKASHRIPARLWPMFLIPGLLFVVALALGLGLTGYLNWVRFHDPLQTGRGDDQQAFPLLAGLYGLLLSSGKSVFLYAPPILLFFFALPRFWKRQMAEALFCLVLIVTFIVFHARLFIWSGDGAWGPRYLVSLMPFWILPLGVIVGEWWRAPVRRAVLILLVGAGLFVNLLGITINFDTFIQIQPSESSRHFEPSASPLRAQWALLTDHLGGWWNGLVSSQNAIVPVRGFLGTAEEDLFPRYLTPRATLVVKSDLNRPTTLTLTALDYRPENKPKRQLAFLSGGVPLQAQRLPADDQGVLNYSVQIPAGQARWAPVDIVTLGSEPVGKSPMGDELGVQLQSLVASAGGYELAMPRYVAIPPLPTADPKVMWGWFFAPVYSQFDFYEWYLYFTGLDDLRVVTIVVVISLLGFACLAASAATLVRTLTGIT